MEPALTTASVKLQLAGACSQLLEIPSLDITVRELRQHIATQEGIPGDGTQLKLIAGGHSLQEGEKALRDYGLTLGTHVLVLGAVSPAEGGALAGAEAAALSSQERATRLDRLKRAAAAMAQRGGPGAAHDDSQYHFELENQAGQKLTLEPGARQAVVTGLALHDRAQSTLQQGAYLEALEELALAEEAWALAPPDVLALCDNPGLLQLDMVWCFFKLGDVALLGSARGRLAAARAALEKAHGPNLERLRILHGNFQPELATYVRLHLLEGVAAYHGGDHAAARTHLLAARAKWLRLQVDDSPVAALVAMGFDASLAIRALRFCGSDPEAAASFAADEHKRQEARRAQQRLDAKLRKEQKLYGRTESGARVDMDALEQLALLGYARPFAAEALRQEDNQFDAALDRLVDPAANAALQAHLAAAAAASTTTATPPLAALTAAGFPEAAARAALQQACGGPNPNPNPHTSHRDLWRATELLAAQGFRPDAPALARMLAAAASPSEPEQAGQPGAADGGPSGSGRQGAAGVKRGSPSDGDEAERRCAQAAEAELAAAARTDPLAAYDVDVREEGAAIQEYLARLS